MSDVRLIGFMVLGLTLAACSCEKPRLQTVDTDTPDAGSCIAAAELCNGLDDDCNGLADDALPTLRCGTGACSREVPSCVSGAVATCSPFAPSTETCNGIDDDCNGAIDDSLMPTQCGVGECASVQSSCADGHPMVCRPGMAGAETCNGKDDDCDGTVDEGLITNTTGDLRITNNPASSDFVYIGKNDTGFGIVWQDKRDGTAGQIYFAALSSQGRRSAASDTRVSHTSGTSAHPALAWNGRSWGLVYSDDTTNAGELYYRPLAADGQPTGTAMRLTNAGADADWPDLLWNGASFAVAWEDQRAGAGKQDIYFERFDENGSRMGGEVRVTSDAARQSSPILKWNGTGYALVWTDFRNAGNREVYFRRLAPDGALLGAEVRLTNDPADSSWPDLAWNDVDKEWAVVWHDTRDGNAEIYLARLDENGSRRGPDTRITNASEFSGYPSIDWNGFEYGVSWQDERLGAGRPAIYFAQVSALGVKNGSELKLSSGDRAASFTTAIWNGSTFAFCWRDDRNGATNTEIYFALVGCP